MSIRHREWTSKGGRRSAWVVNYTDAKGKRRLKHFKTKRAAQDWDAGTRMDLKKGTHVADAVSITVEEAGRLWITAAKEAGLEHSTCEQYRQHAELHIVPFIGATKLNKLTVPAVRAFEDKLREEGRSPEHTAKIITSLGSIIADAMERGLAMRNPVRERRRRRKAQARHKPKLAVGVDIPAPAEIRAALNIAKGRSRALLAVAALAGLRSSELRGLPWRDVDLNAATITVSQRADAWRKLGSPKAAASRRTIPVSPLVVNTLKEWKLACPRRDTSRTDSKGKPIKELDLVFPSEDGLVESHGHALPRDWQELQVAAGIVVPERDRYGKPVLEKDSEPVMRAKYPGLHCLRHFFASWCAAPQPAGLGLPLKTVQVRMGHSTLAMTADTYGHLFPSQDDAQVLAAGERALMGA